MPKPEVKAKPKTHRRTWQKAESRAAALFGSKRQPLSGSSGRDDETQSDSTHPTLFLETKLKAKTFVRALYDETKLKAKREAKLPVLCLYDKGRPGCLVCVHSDDLKRFAAIALADEQSREWPTVLAEVAAANKLSEES